MSDLKGLVFGLRGRTALGLILVMGCITLFMWLYFPPRLENGAMRAIEEKTADLAVMAAHTLAAAIYFDDTAALTEVLDGMGAADLVGYAVVTDSTGAILAVMGRDMAEEAGFRGAGLEPATDTSGEFLRARAPVEHGGATIGTIYIGQSLSDVHANVAATRRDVAMLAVLIFFLGSGGILSLAGAADRLGRHNSKLEAQLAQSQKMEAVGRLAGGVAHDFNNLLTTINGTAAVALADVPQDAPERRDLEEILRAGQRAADLTSQLLAFTRQQVHRPRAVDLNGAIEEAASMLRRMIGENVALHVDLSPAGPWVRADPSQLVQILMNLAVNARDALPNGGDIWIETGELDLDEAAAAVRGVSKPGPHAMLRVRDNGHGMDEETLRSAFEPFFTTKEVGKGTGLGLATVYGIVTQNAGAAAIDSTPGQGTTVTVLLPRTAAAAGESAPEGNAVGPASQAAGRILLVEDQDSVRNLIERVLKRSGYDVIGTRDAAEALEVASREDMPLDLLVTDVVMPGMQGPELATTLVDRRPGLKVLYVSGYTRNEVLRTEELGDNAAFLTKPMSPADLVDTVATLLDRKVAVRA